MHRRAILGAIGGAVAVAGCLDQGEPANGTPDDENGDQVRILSHELFRREEGTDEETVVIQGLIRILEEGLEHVELEGRFFDEDEELLDTTTERVQEVDVGRHEFEIVYPQFGEPARAVAGYQVSVGTIINI